MTQCKQCGKRLGELERTHWICDPKGDVCDTCFEAHLLTCDACYNWHEQDQAQLAAWQLSKGGRDTRSNDYEPTAWMHDGYARADEQIAEEIGL